MASRQNRLSKFWTELKRRKVVRVIIVYATTAFIIMQFANLLEDTFELPIWFDKTVTILLIIGFPIAIIFSWIFDMTPKGIEVTQSSSANEYEDFRNPKTGKKIPKPIPGFLSEQKIIENDSSLFVARENELNLLLHTLAKISTGNGQFYFITGDAGSGKTTLVNQLINEAQRNNNELIVLYGKCDAHTGISNPYLPFREMLLLLHCEIETKWESGTITANHAKRLFDFFPSGIDILTNEGKNLIGSFVPKDLLIKKVKEYPYEKSGYSNLKISQIESIAEEKDIQSINQNKLFEQFISIVQSISKKKPLLLILDDLHWADIGSIKLLSILTKQIGQNRIMIVGTFRPAEVALGRGDGKHPLDTVLNEIKRIYGNTLLELDVLDGKLFVEKLIDAEPNNLGNDFRKTMMQQTKGHPLFTVELYKDMQERGILVKDNMGLWKESSSLKWDNLPPRVDAIIEDRLGRLSKKYKNVLTQASIMGEEFIAEVVAKQSKTKVKDIINILSSDLDKRHRLVNAKGIKRLNGNRLSFYQFRHVLFQKHLYNSLDAVERCFLHEETGKLLEEMFKENMDEMAIQLAWHFSQAGIIEKAIVYQHKAALRAKALYANEEALEHFNKIIELINSDNSIKEKEEKIKLKIDVYEEIGKLQALKLDNDEARNTFLKALSYVAGDKIIWRCRLHREIATTFTNQKQFDNSLQEFNKAKSLLGENAFEPLKNWWYEKIEIELERMWLFYWQAKADEMIETAEKIRPNIEKYGMPVQRARFFVGLVLLNYRRFKYRISEDTLKISRSALEASMESENADSIFLSTFVRGFTFLWHGSSKEASIYLKKALELTIKNGDKAYHSRSLTYLAVSYRRLNLPEKVSEIMSDCICVSEEANLQEYVGAGYGNMCWIELKNGNLDKARQYGKQAIEIYRSIDAQPAIKTVEWIILLPMLSICILDDNFVEAIKHLRDLTDHPLMLLDGDIVEHAEKAVMEWDSDKHDTAIKQIKKVNLLAKEYHYI